MVSDISLRWVDYTLMVIATVAELYQNNGSAYIPMA